MTDSQQPHQAPEELQARTESSAVPVPVFNCRVFVSREGATYRARVANLAGLEATAGSEREAISQIVKAFKSAVASYVEQGNQPPWLDPELTPEAQEVERLIPVHL